MSFLSKILRSTATPVALALPAGWMPEAKMKRVILHWTAGSYVPSSLDKEHYHFLVDGKAELVRGLHPVTANEVIGSKSPDDYAAHTRGTNTGAIGISICSMAGAQDAPFKAGKYPLTEAQWITAAQATAALCKRYGIPVTSTTVLTHAEVQPNLGIKQNGKWDIARLAFDPTLIGAKACGDDFRRRVKEFM